MRTHASPTFSRLLLATEHSEFDVGAERVALALAGRLGVTLTVLLPILSNPEYEAVAPQLAERADAAAARSLGELAAQATAAGVAAEMGVRRGPERYREIVDGARAHAADLLIVRRRGKPGLLANLLVGEMVTKVLAHAPCTVLVVPREAALFSRGVLVAVDPAAPARAPLARAAALAAASALPLHVVVVTDSQGAARAEQVLEQALASARALLPNAQGERLSGRPHQQIIDAAARHGADLIAVGRNGGEGFARAWIGGVAQKVIGLSPGAVLVGVPDQPMKADSK